MDIAPFFIQPLGVDQSQPGGMSTTEVEWAGRAKIPGYFVVSSAPPDIEDANEPTQAVIDQTSKGIDQIAEHLYRCHRMTGGAIAPELVIAIHGFNTRKRDVKAWYDDIFHYINNRDQAIAAREGAVFIGYRWPSETIRLSRLSTALSALPPLPAALLGLSILLSLGLVLASFWVRLGRYDALFSFGIILCVFVASLILTLVFLRVAVYFRDRYRAENFGVPDLVELIRLLDKAIVDKTTQDLYASGTEPKQAKADAIDYWEHHPIGKIQLSFIGHSMGGLVVTNTMRILSDVFDSRSIGKQPPSDIGYVFSLNRLILASPDIPVLTIISSRANFLASSVRRFREAYLLSNEGDMALRTASTTANYFSFPSRTRTRGYRLGNVSLKSDHSGAQAYGLINLPNLDQFYATDIPLDRAIVDDPQHILDCLFIACSRRYQGGYATLANLFEDQEKKQAATVSMADLFTIIDCTDYRDYVAATPNRVRSQSPRPILSQARGKRCLNTWDYLFLSFDYLRGKLDVHGGYFQGEFSQALIYRLAFLGFQSGVLATFHPEPQTALSLLDQRLREIGMQVFLSPLRYRTDVQGQPFDEAKNAILHAIRI